MKYVLPILLMIASLVLASCALDQSQITSLAMQECEKKGGVIKIVKTGDSLTIECMAQPTPAGSK